MKGDMCHSMMSALHQKGARRTAHGGICIRSCIQLLLCFIGVEMKRSLPRVPLLEHVNLCRLALCVDPADLEL